MSHLAADAGLSYTSRAKRPMQHQVAPHRRRVWNRLGLLGGRIYKQIHLHEKHLHNGLLSLSFLRLVPV